MMLPNTHELIIHYQGYYFIIKENSNHKRVTLFIISLEQTGRN